MPEGTATDFLRHRSRGGISSRLSKYGSALEPPEDNAVFYPEDDTHSFFARGRDFESVYVNHKYTAEERRTLGTYESLDYLPSHSMVYKQWLQRQPRSLDWDRWLMMGLIGLAVGLIGFLLHQVIDVINKLKWDFTEKFLTEESMLVAWGWSLGHGIIFVSVSTMLVVLLRPSAGGSGIPELIGFLNGTVVRHIFNVKTMVVKFLSCCCAVGSGMPVGPEGPMIHLGSLVGAGLSQFKSDTLRFKIPFFERFRNSEDRRNFISAGAAAGVASAFGAPVGGLLFSMEEVSSFWNLKLAWQIFFCAMVSTFTTDLFNSAFQGFRYSGHFGLFKAENYILFKVNTSIGLHILAFVPAVILGVMGGLLGALFNFINLKIARGRNRLLAKVRTMWKQKMIRICEPLIIMVIVVTASTFLPSAFPCSPYSCITKSDGTNSKYCLSNPQNPMHTERTVKRYTCPEGVMVEGPNGTWTNKTFNEMATLLFVTGEEAIKHLFSRETHLEFSFAPLVTALCYYFIVACWAAGTSISSGLVVPMLFIGGLYGRLIGRAMVAMFGVNSGSMMWAWIDPGVFALIGAASFFGGVSRLTVSLTVIMIEITNDVRFLLPIMVAIIVAKWIGDFFTHPLYHALLELKCIPFLDAEPIIVHKGNKVVNLELFAARDIMTSEPVTLQTMVPVRRLAEVLLTTNHGGFPVVRGKGPDQNLFFGFINRLEVALLLQQEHYFVSTEDLRTGNVDKTHLDYQRLTLDKLSDPAGVDRLLEHFVNDDQYKDLYLDLEPYVNQSAVTVPGHFSLHRTYIIFRTLGLRHLTVLDEANSVVGVITRKDLMGYSMEEKLNKVMYKVAPPERNVELQENIEALPTS